MYVCLYNTRLTRLHFSFSPPLFFLPQFVFLSLTFLSFFTYLLNVKGFFKYSSSGFITVVCHLCFKLWADDFTVSQLWCFSCQADVRKHTVKCHRYWHLFCLLCSRVMTYREHGAWVVKAHLQKETDGHIISVRYALALSLMIYTTCFRPGCLYWLTDRLIPHQC